MHLPFFPQVDSPEIKLIRSHRRSQSPLVEVSSVMHPYLNFPPSMLQPVPLNSVSGDHTPNKLPVYTQACVSGSVFWGTQAETVLFQKISW